MTNYTLTADPGADPIVSDGFGGTVGTGSAGTLFSISGNDARSVQGAVAADGFHMAYGEPTYASAFVLSSSFGVTPSVSAAWGQTLQELIAISPLAAPAMRYSKAIYDLAVFQHTVNMAAVANLVDNAAFTAAISAARGQVLQEVMKLADTPQGAAKYGLALLETFQLQDELFKFFNGTISDAMQFADTMLAKYRPTAAVADGVVIGSTLSPLLMIGMEIDDSFEIDDAQVLKMIFNGVIADALNIRALHVEPNGELTTWAINTRTSAVTEYQNWDFNSFAKIGNHYLGASDKGLFLMDGPRDITDNIPSHVKSGKMSTGSKFTTLFSAYLGMSMVDDDAPNDFFLKMVAGDGREYVYAVKPAPDGVTTKVNMGKGLRSRYFTYELISEASDWDLDSIEFIPIVSKRRV